MKIYRQQLIVASRAVKRPAFRVHERCLLVLLASLHRQWRDALLRVKPDTVLRYFNTARPHRGIGQRTPVPSEHLPASFAASVTAVPVLGGLHHEYRAAA